ncbi:hypothetical protein [Nocardioides bizhenqiangii]|uniref:Uncharacterized protein n=1 Tax=Nocardioides bizhenqiangii TaxID=3095076 RepID=A0ABZ0ZSJ0_9ACTN|nr:hypothetical protein [Nocardioides sp. HM61]WQQ26759.1 hypothetical protein SHK19_00665 [Nocardioides sp. HM61]
MAGGEQRLRQGQTQLGRLCSRLRVFGQRLPHHHDRLLGEASRTHRRHPQLGELGSHGHTCARRAVHSEPIPPKRRGEVATECGDLASIAHRVERFNCRTLTAKEALCELDAVLSLARQPETQRDMREVDQGPRLPHRITGRTNAGQGSMKARPGVGKASGVSLPHRLQHQGLGRYAMRSSFGTDRFREVTQA